MKRTLSLLLSAGGADHLHPVFAEHFGGRLADPPARAGHNDGLALYAAEIHSHILLFDLMCR